VDHPQPGRRRHVVRDLLLVGFAAAAGVALFAGYAWYQIDKQGRRDEARAAGAIVVLGAAQYDGRPSGVFAARLDHAVDLFLAGRAPYLVVTGGKLPGDRTTEAAVARAYALERGVPGDRILVEDAGRSTLESLRSVGTILRGRGIHDALFVSDRTHMFRVLLMARDQGLTAYGSPTATSPTDADPRRRLGATLHELGGLAVYFLAGEESAGDFGPPPDPTSTAGSVKSGSAPSAP
jgi:uncharacterized SAM-binding protein YcdF (DUF218 family)